MSKYHNKHTEQDGYTFDSLAESRRYWELKALERAGEISGLVVHPKFVLQEAVKVNGETIRAITYSPDFQYFDHNGMQVAEDVKGGKGTVTEVYKLKRKLFIVRYPNIRFEEVQA